MSLEGKRIVLAGAASASGVAAARELRRRGAGVVAIARDLERLERAMDGLGVTCLAADLRDPDSLSAVAEQIRAGGGVDGVFQLVGGWRGGGGIAGQSLADWEFLSGNIVDSLRLVSQEFYQDLVAAPAGRIAIVSATAVDKPTASNANYATAKASAETWMQALAQGFRAADSLAASVRFVVKALLDDAMREAEPERAFPGYTDVDALARAFADLFEDSSAQGDAELNGARISLVPDSASTAS